MERRTTTGPEIRIESRDGKTVVTGYGAVFHREEDSGSEYRMFPDLVERIDRRAFDRALSEKHNAAGLFNHDPNQLLGRVAAGTMRLSVDERGLRYEIDLPDTQAGRDVAKHIERKDVTGSSFAFRVTKEEWEERDGYDLRVIEDVELYDTGPVVFPAYASTTTGLRSEDNNEACKSRDAWKKNKQQMKMARERRIRMIELDSVW